MVSAPSEERMEYIESAVSAISSGVSVLETSKAASLKAFVAALKPSALTNEVPFTFHLKPSWAEIPDTSVSTISQSLSKYKMTPTVVFLETIV